MAKKSSTPTQQIRAGSGLLGRFDKLPDLGKDIVCALVMLLVVYALFWGVIVHDRPFGLSGDTESAFQWKRALDHIRDTEGADPLWVPYIYGGMPVAGSLLFPRDVNYIETYLLKPVFGKLLFLFSDAHYILLHVFLSGLFMYLLVRTLNFQPLVALLAGLVFMMYPHSISLWESFHWSKLATWSFTPLLFLLTYQLFEKRNFLTLGLLSATIGTMFLNRHPQMAFYAMLGVGCYFLYEAALCLKKEPVLVFWKALLLAFAVLLGLAIYSYEMLPTQEYAQFSVRGGGSENPSGGANYDWATSWSAHPLELITYVIPSFFGFSSQVLSDWQGQRIGLPLYWGWMPFTDSPPYLGIVPIVLSLFALIYRRNRMTWFLMAFSLLVVFLSFGNHLSIVYDLFFNYFPYFNKFRAPSLVLYLMPFSIGLLGVYGLSWIIDAGRAGPRDTAGINLAQGLTRGLYVCAGLLVLVLIGKGVLRDFMSGFMFDKPGEVQRYGPQVVAVFKEKRFDLLWQDMVKILIFAGITLALFSLYLRRKLSESGMVLGLVVLCFVDLYLIGVQFINTRPQNEITDRLKPDATMNFLKSDTTVFRVLSLEQDLSPSMNNDLMNNQLQSVSGYSPAKLRIYQEMLDSAFARSVDQVMPFNMNVVGMMNTRYVISPVALPPGMFRQVFADPAKKLTTYEYTRSLGRAWFVDSALATGSKGEMYAAMNSPGWKPGALAILNEPVPEGIGSPDSAWVRVTAYGSRAISLRAYTSRPALLVLSEVYYPAGWTATVDGAETKIFRTNAVLRSVVVPAGEHEVKFAFDPDSFRLGSTVTGAGWTIVALLVVVGMVRDKRIRGLPGKTS